MFVRHSDVNELSGPDVKPNRVLKFAYCWGVTCKGDSCVGECTYSR